MRNLCILLAVLAISVSCQQDRKSSAARKADRYALIQLQSPFIEGISDHGKEVLDLYKFAAEEVDRIYWKQSFGDKALLMDALSDPGERAYAQINYGPWDRISGLPFVEGYGPRPAGARFYPEDMTHAEFAACADPDKSSPYTVLRRDADGKLHSVWYHDAYKEEIERICNYLQAAADLTIKPSVRAYLLKKIEALRTDDYYESEIAWLDMDDSKMDLVLGPDESTDDALYGVKSSYEAFVLLKDLKRTEEVTRYVPVLPELQKALPCDEAYKTFVPGDASNLFVCDVLRYAGQANAGIKVIAINLPFDPKVQAEKGTRTILFHNVAADKFNRTVFPIGSLLLEKDQQLRLDADAFFWNIVFREVAHGLGVKETVNGRGSVAEALGNETSTWEEAKANVVGLFLVCHLIDQNKISALIEKEDVLTTFFAGLMRSTRFGTGEPLGRANIMCYNYLLEQGAFKRQADGRYALDFGRFQEAVSKLAGLILKTQATGDYAFARSFEEKYAVISETLAADHFNFEHENIPVDLRFE